jgi:hypothetical protein
VLGASFRKRRTDMTRNFTAAPRARQASRTRILVAASALVALAALGAPAHAQYSPYALPTGTFNNMFQTQSYLDDLGRRMAIDGGMNAYWMMQDYRARTGFTGDFPSFVTPDQLRQSGADLSRATAGYRQSADANSMARMRGADNYANYGVMNQRTMVGPGGGYYPYVSGAYDRVFDTPRGLVGTNDPTYQPWGGVGLMPLR